MAIQFLPATRDAVYARICAYGPGGSGKTLTGLMLLHRLCKGEKFAVVETERGRIKKYAESAEANPWGLDWKFDIVTPSTFEPDSLVEALGVAAGHGYPAIMIDSGSPYWNGPKGILEQVDRVTVGAGRKDTYSTGWKEIGPTEARLWGAIMTYPGHVYMSLRVKTEYVIEEVIRDGRRLSVPRKVGLKPVQRDTFEYEFDLVLECDQANTFTVTKSDILPVPQGTVLSKPGPEFAEILRVFCAKGTTATGAATYRAQALDPTATRDGLLELLATVERAGLQHAPIVDEFEQPTVLGELIRARGRAVRAAMDAQARIQARQEALAAKERAATTEAAAPNDGRVTRGQLAQIDYLFVDKLNVGDAATQLVLAGKVLDLPGPVSDLADLTYKQATALLAELAELVGVYPDGVITELLGQSKELVTES